MNINGEHYIIFVLSRKDEGGREKRTQRLKISKMLHPGFSFFNSQFIGSLAEGA